MPLSYTEVENTRLKKLAEFYCVKEYVRIKVDSATEKQLPFPSDYKFSQCFLPKKYLSQADRIENFHVNADDIWVVSFPKAGRLSFSLKIDFKKNIIVCSSFCRDNVDLEYCIIFDEPPGFLGCSQN